MKLLRRRECPHLKESSDYKDRTNLENWRPISLTNVEAKIPSKGKATRIIKVIPKDDFYGELRGIKSLIRLWSCRGLSLFVVNCHHY